MTTASSDADGTHAQVTAANLDNTGLMSCFGLGGPPKARGRPKLIGDELGG